MGLLRLLALDIDGTILRDDGTISPLMIEVLRKIQEEKGVLITLASGRLFQSMQALAQTLEVKVPIISSNGAAIADPKTGQKLFYRPIPLSTAKSVLAYLEDHLPRDLLVNHENGFYINRHNSLLRIPDPSPWVRERLARCTVVDRLADGVHFEPLKISILEETARIPETVARLQQGYASVLNIFPSSEFSIDLNAYQVSKGQTLARLAARLGIRREEIMAAGNAENDLDMIQFSGVGIAMANAPQRVREAADLVAGDNNEDGLALLLKDYFGV